MSIPVKVGKPSDWLLQRYRLLAKLNGHKGPINCFAFNKDGALLASGGENLAFDLYGTNIPAGDDQAVRVWHVSSLQCAQIIEDRNCRWGQITCLKFINFDAGDWMCFGTGQGRFLVYCRPRRSVSELSADMESTDRRRELYLPRYRALQFLNLVTALRAFLSTLFTAV